MYEIGRFKCILGQITWYLGFRFFDRCVNLGKIFKNEIYLFSFGQSMKKIIIVKIGYFCMGQRMMWNSVVNLSYIFCQQVDLCKLYKHMKKEYSTHNTCIKYTQSGFILFILHL
jgi:hypothetical protein